MSIEIPADLVVGCLVIGCPNPQSGQHGGGCSEAHGKIAANIVATGGSGVPGDDVPFPNPDPDPDAMIFDPYKNGGE